MVGGPRERRPRLSFRNAVPDRGVDLKSVRLYPAAQPLARAHHGIDVPAPPAVCESALRDVSGESRRTDASLPLADRARPKGAGRPARQELGVGGTDLVVVVQVQNRGPLPERRQDQRRELGRVDAEVRHVGTKLLQRPAKARQGRRIGDLQQVAQVGGGAVAGVVGAIGDRDRKRGAGEEPGIVILRAEARREAPATDGRRPRTARRSRGRAGPSRVPEATRRCDIDTIHRRTVLLPILIRHEAKAIHFVV